LEDNWFDPDSFFNPIPHAMSIQQISNERQLFDLPLHPASNEEIVSSLLPNTGPSVMSQVPYFTQNHSATSSFASDPVHPLPDEMESWLPHAPSPAPLTAHGEQQAATSSTKRKKHKKESRKRRRGREDGTGEKPKKEKRRKSHAHAETANTTIVDNSHTYITNNNSTITNTIIINQDSSVITPTAGQFC
jgi:hypothetical protein